MLGGAEEVAVNVRLRVSVGCYSICWWCQVCISTGWIARNLVNAWGNIVSVG